MLPPITIVIPAFNEAHRISETLATVLEYLQRETAESELIVVDDGSSDTTSEIVQSAFANSGRISTRLIRHSPNRGKGAAVRDGILAAKYPIALFSDADLSTPINETPKLIEPILRGDADIAIGSRALDRKLIGNRQPWRREQGGRVFNLVVRLATGLPFWDTQCGFKAFRLEVCRSLFEQSRVAGFGFDVELLFLAQRAGLRMREIPVRWNHHDGSKVHFLRDSVAMLREVISLRTIS
ncbi:MAG: dolichyl-phosphate beta-glucosyltransferase [Chthoniobacterales bacterium]